MFTVKGNRPALLAAITDRLPAATAATSAHTDTERRSGYRVTRTIWVAPATCIDFPGAATVFRLRRDVYAPDGQRISKQIVHGITSLTSAGAKIARHVRTHWWIENKVCATQRLVVFPAQPGEIGGTSLGLMAYPDAERRRGPEHASKPPAVSKREERCGGRPA